MFPWMASNTGYFSEDSSSHEWTEYHDLVIEHHLETGILPHPSTHTKVQAMEWAKGISRSFQTVDWASLVGSFAAILVHHRVPKEEAKKTTLELSHKLATVSQFTNLVGYLWDQYVLHEQNPTNPTVNSARQVANLLRQQARRT